MYQWHHHHKTYFALFCYDHKVGKLPKSTRPTSSDTLRDFWGSCRLPDSRLTTGISNSSNNPPETQQRPMVVAWASNCLFFFVFQADLIECEGDLQVTNLFIDFLEKVDPVATQMPLDQLGNNTMRQVCTKVLPLRAGRIGWEAQIRVRADARLEDQQGVIFLKSAGRCWKLPWK